MNEVTKKNRELVTLLDLFKRQTEINESTESRLNDHEDKLDYLFTKQELTTSEADEIKTQVKRIVRNSLSDVEYPVYAKKVFKDAYRYLRNFGASNKLERTERGRYKDLIEALKDYSPNIELLKAEHDRSYKAKQDYRLRMDA